MSLEKELARKLAWAVNSTFDTPEHVRRRTRVWSWRVACKMVAANAHLAIDNTRSPPDNGMAGGGVDRATQKTRSAPKMNPVRPQPRRYDASAPNESHTDVRLGDSGTCSRGCCVAPSCESRSCGRRGGSRCVRRPAGSDDRWRCPNAAQAPASGTHC